MDDGAAAGTRRLPDAGPTSRVDQPVDRKDSLKKAGIRQLMERKQIIIKLLFDSYFMMGSLTQLSA